MVTSAKPRMSQQVGYDQTQESEMLPKVCLPISPSGYDYLMSNNHWIFFSSASFNSNFPVLEKCGSTVLPL